MRTTYNWITFSLLFLPGLAISQQSSIEASLQKGNATEFGAHFNKTVELCLPDLEESYTAEIAIDKLAAFFKKHIVKGYKRNHLSSLQEGRANYSIGDLFTGNGTYRITIYFNAQQKITEVRIEK